MEITMKKIFEDMKTIDNMDQALDLISVMAEKYNLINGYKIETFISYHFIRISVYKEGK